VNHLGYLIAKEDTWLPAPSSPLLAPPLSSKIGNLHDSKNSSVSDTFFTKNQNPLFSSRSKNVMIKFQKKWQ
jgi:hypothetical protein